MDPGLALAERIHAVLRGLGVRCALIGVQAMEVHGYSRPTSDVDLALAITLPELRRVADALRAEGLAVELRDPTMWIRWAASWMCPPPPTPTWSSS